MPLHPEAQAFRDEVAAKNAPGWNELPPGESREIFNGFNAMFGVGPEVYAVRDLQTDSGVPLRMYRPSKAAVLPALLYFHGGGWVLGNIGTHDALCRGLANASGRAVVAVDYRLAPEHPYPAAFDDCYEATELVAASAAQLGVDAARIAVGGDSAGGNLAAAVALRARDARRAGEVDPPQIERQVLIYPVVEPNFESGSYQEFATNHVLTQESMRWFWNQYVGERPPTELPYAALMNADLSDLPPAIVLTAEYDVLRDEGEQYAARLGTAGCAVEHRRFPGMLHGFVHFSGLFQDGLAAIEHLGEYLKKSP